MTRRFCLAVLVGALAVFTLAQDASAQGFKIQESGPSHGNAGAGSAATADDPTTVFFNPAGMTGLRGHQGSAIAKYYDFSVRYRDRGSEDLLGDPMRGGNGRNAGDRTFLPSFYAVIDGGERVRYGIGVNNPFGLETDYGDTWAGRYHATHSKLTVINVNPSFAYRLSDQWSVGAGVNIQYAEVTLENAVDFGSIAVDQLGAGPAGQLGLEPQRDDGRVKIDGDSYGWGLNAGVHWRPRPATRLGLSWRSAVSHRLKGDAHFVVPRNAARLTAAGSFRDDGVKADLTIPQSVLFGAGHDLTPEWTIVGGFEWTHFSRFRQIKVEFDDPHVEDQIEREDWDDTTRTMVGAIFRPEGRWTFRGGFAHDASPVDSGTRRPRLPDADRTTLAVGAGYRLSERSTIELGYMRAWWRDASIDRTDPAAGRIRGTARSSVNYVGVTFTLDF